MGDDAGGSGIHDVGVVAVVGGALGTLILIFEGKLVIGGTKFDWTGCDALVGESIFKNLRLYNVFWYS